MEFILITTPTCTKCHEVKEYLEGKDIQFSLVDATTEGGTNLCIYNRVQSAPTLLVINESKEVRQLRDIFSIKEFFDNGCVF